eukprot:gene14774-19855_t
MYPLNMAEISENSMSIDDVKSELELRGVNFDDCVSKQQLVDRLVESRAIGKADPDILKKFNEQNDLELNDLDDNFLSDALDKDGNLPGGLSKDVLKAIATDKSVVQMLRDPKMQDIMKAVMTGGPDGLKKYLSDPDALILLQKLGEIMGKINSETKK